MFVLDTNVISELIRLEPDPVVTAWVELQTTSDLFTTTINEAELRYGVEILPEGRRRDVLETGIERMFTSGFTNRILSFEREAARAYAIIAATRRSIGQPVSQADCQIAAIAATQKMAVATRNVSDFEDMGIKIVNPWV